MRFSDKSLRPWRQEDAPAVLKAAGEPLMSRQFGGVSITTLEDAEAWIAGRSEAEDAHYFAVLDEHGDAVGNMSVVNIDLTHESGVVGYWLMERARGKGLASQACRTLCEFAFGELGLFRLELGHRMDNPASCRVAIAAGFAVEGLERARLLYDGVRYDVEKHSRLATD